ncbi:MAG: PLP-dependent aminotransferase family protein [Nitratireductor sp.]|nr:PLP-dependent aminotransferase family protein [Nitratireductor sp.]
MRYSLFHLDRREATTLQAQIKEMLVSAMLSGQLAADTPIPSTRAMARRLDVSRNTVMAAYQALAADGYLEARERSGFYVSPGMRDGMAAANAGPSQPGATAQGKRVDWRIRLATAPSDHRVIDRPANWHDYPYPFIYGQADAAQFPITAWRDCVRQAMSRKWMDAWTDDRYAADDPTLVEQIRQKVLTRRGILASPDEIIVTLGAQNALYLLGQLLVRPDMKVAIEDPGYPDIRNILGLFSKNLLPVSLDGEGIRVDRLNGADLVFVTPSHQSPTSVTMSMARRHELLHWAQANDTLIIEDDYEYETNYRGESAPALKSLDRDGRVLHVGSLSKSLMPGLRMGFLVAPAELVAELRALRKLMLRHPPGNNQRVVAIFLAQGHHDALIKRLHRSYLPRWQAMKAALDRHFPGWARTPVFGGTSFWVEGPEGFDARELATRALEVGVVIEPGDVCFAEPELHRNYFRLGFSTIPLERIEPGIERLAEVAVQLLREKPVDAPVQ